MERVCAKCGTVNPSATGDVTDACPSCGAIYAKVALAQVRQQLAAARLPTDRGSFPTWRIVIAAVVVMALIAVGLAYQRRAAQAHATAQQAAQAAAQAAARKAAMVHGMQEFNTLDQQRVDWETQLRIAGASPRIALAGPVKDLAETARRTRALTFDTPCVDQSRNLLASAMDARVDAFLLFMRERDSDATDADERAAGAMSDFESYGVKCMRAIRDGAGRVLD